MGNYVDFLNTIKQVVVETIQSTNPMGIVFGKVANTSPFKIQIDQKLILGEKQLILTNTFKNITQNAIIGETYVLLRMQGGQKYMIIDKMGGD